MDNNNKTDPVELALFALHMKATYTVKHTVINTLDYLSLKPFSTEERNQYTPIEWIEKQEIKATELLRYTNSVALLFGPENRILHLQVDLGYEQMRYQCKYLKCGNQRKDFYIRELKRPLQKAEMKILKEHSYQRQQIFFDWLNHMAEYYPVMYDDNIQMEKYMLSYLEHIIQGIDEGILRFGLNTYIELFKNYEMALRHDITSLKKIIDYYETST